MNLKQVLISFGLSPNESLVYLTCLSLGSASVYKISQNAGIPRSTCYEIIKTLNKKKLVSTYLRKKVKYFNAEDPSEIIKFERKKVDTLEQYIPELRAMYASKKNKPSVRYYEGRSGMKLVLQELLEEADEILAFSSADDLFANLGDYWPEFLERRIKKKINVKTILKDTPLAHKRQNIEAKELREVKIISSTYNYRGLVMMWKNKIGMFSFSDEMFVLVTDSKEISETQKAMFYIMWNSLK